MKGRQGWALGILLGLCFGSALLLQTGPRMFRPAPQNLGEKWFDDRLLEPPPVERSERRSGMGDGLNSGTIRSDYGD